MSGFKKQTYDNSYLFSLPGEMNKHHSHITEFILKSQRIENKRSDNFRGVVEDVKRYQKSSVLYTVLLRNDIVLCYADVEMSPAFKVFSAKDLKKGDGNKVFIDVTGIIENRNGYYICNNVAKLCTYLFQAITWIVYDINPLALMNNSNITLPAAECWISMFDYMIGYFRFNGYKENRSKILYLAALYFLLKVLAKDDDQYTKQIAAKLSGTEATLIKAYDLYYDASVNFVNINSFITFLAETFKLKGLTTEVFISKWIYICGTGTQFAPELFTAFSNMVVGAYCGAYIVNQKSIEKQCGTALARFGDALLKVGANKLDKGRFFESAEEADARVYRDRNTVALAEATINKRNTPDNAKFDKEDCKSKYATDKKIYNMIKWYISTEQETTLGNRATTACKIAIECMDNSRPKEAYEIGVLECILRQTKKYMSKKNKDDLTGEINNAVRIQTDYMKENRLDNKEFADRLSKQISELYRCKAMI